jgi:hypothetical protein
MITAVLRLRFTKMAVLFLTVSIVSSGCVSYRYTPVAEVPFLERAQTQEDGKVQATVSVLSDKEAKDVFGVSLARKGMQAVWLKIENRSESPYIFLQGTVDPDYFSPDEAAYASHFSTRKKIFGMGLLSVIFFPLILAVPFEYTSAKFANKKMDQVFNKLAISNDMVMPGETISGFTFTPLDEGSKEVSFSLTGKNKERKFSFFFKVPGIKADYMDREFLDLYDEKDFIVYDHEKDLADALRALPCCTTDERGRGQGDPLNLIFIGEPDDIWMSLKASRWDETEVLGFKTGMKMFRSVLFGRSYRYSPMSALYFEGRIQDISFQKARGTVKRRLHLRLWYTSLRFKERPVWVGTVSRDIGIRMSLKHWYLTDHVIDSNIDDARESVLADLINERRVLHYGFVSGVGKVGRTAPRKNLSGNQYYTDGYRIVLVPSGERTAASVFGCWDFPEDENGEGFASADHGRGQSPSGT